MGLFLGCPYFLQQTLVRFERYFVGCSEISLPTSTSDRRYATATGLPILEHGALPALPPSHRVGSDMWIITGTLL